jgi:biofilm PGA synthesis N-glycosyltransferase PgaC
MEYVYFILGNILFLYSIAILLIIYSFYDVPEITYQTTQAVNKFSVVIVVTNHESYLERLISSLVLVNYPTSKFEVIFVNNNSRDSSIELINGLMKYTKISYSVVDVGPNKKGRKESLTAGIFKSSHPWIITTMADCEVSSMWLKSFDQKLQENDKLNFVAGPVSLSLSQDDVVTNLQNYDFTALTGVTVGGFGMNMPFLCHGANILFSKSKFLDYGGFQNADSKEDDDLYLLSVFRNNCKYCVDFLKSQGAIVNASLAVEFSHFIKQRVKWISKKSTAKSKVLKMVITFVGISNITLALSLVLFIITFDFKLLFFIMFTIISNFWILKISNNMLGKKMRLFNFPAYSIIFPFYIITLTFLALKNKKLFQRG